jgi:hypothetical protein
MESIGSLARDYGIQIGHPGRKRKKFLGIPRKFLPPIG